MLMKGIDVSVHNGSIDWAKVKASGVDFAIIRAGYGSVASQKDKKFEENYKGATKQGIAVGAYWYSYAKNIAQAEEEAKTCLSIIKGKKFDMPIFYDLEESSTFNSGQTNAIASKFCEILEAAGYWVGIYSSSSAFNHYFNDSIKKRFSIWTAHWNTDKPAHPSEYDVWQYTDKGKVTGINENTDLNYCYRNFPELIKKYNKNGYTNDGAVSADEINVCITLNGKTYQGILKG